MLRKGEKKQRKKGKKKRVLKTYYGYPAVSVITFGLDKFTTLSF